MFEYFNYVGIYVVIFKFFILLIYVIILFRFLLEMKEGRNRRRLSLARATRRVPSSQSGVRRCAISPFSRSRIRSCDDREFSVGNLQFFPCTFLCLDHLKISLQEEIFDMLKSMQTLACMDATM